MAVGHRITHHLILAQVGFLPQHHRHHLRYRHQRHLQCHLQHHIQGQLHLQYLQPTFQDGLHLCLHQDLHHLDHHHLDHLEGIIGHHQHLHQAIHREAEEAVDLVPPTIQLQADHPTRRSSP